MKKKTQAAPAEAPMTDAEGRKLLRELYQIALQHVRRMHAKA
jgi:hypothetical protein